MHLVATGRRSSGLRRARRPSRGLLLAHAVLAAAPLLAHAGVGFSSGSATWSWDADTATANGGKTTFTIAPPPSGSMPVSPSFQLNRSGSFGSGNATGSGSIGYITNSTTATFTLAGGSGAAQTDPGDVNFPGGTVTKVQFSGLFSPTSPGFGPTATGYFSLSVGGTAGIQGSTQVAFDMQFRLNNAAGALLRSNINGGTTFFGGTEPTSFRQVWTYSAALSPSTISPSDKVFVSGSMTFIASNQGSPSDIRPLGLDAGAAPPTATFYGDGGFGLDWSNPATWTPPENPGNNVFAFTEPGALIPAVPDGVGTRARFFGNAGEGRGATLSQPVTIGSLHIDSRSTIGISGEAANNLTMDVLPADNASIYVGNSNGNGAHQINAEVLLADNLEIRVEAALPDEPDGGSELNFNKPITSVGTPKAITISGGGIVQFNAANGHDGTTTITDGGQLNVNADGGLGAGPVVVNNGGLLVVNAAAPTSAGQPINVGAGGSVRVNPFVGASLNYSIADGAVVSGDGTFLGSLTVGTPPAGNLQLAPGAIIGHLDFDTSPSAGNPQNIGNNPLYVFAIATDFVDPGVASITIGTASGSPWRGFGNDGQTRVYGGSPASPGSAAVDVAGDADLVSPGGALILNAPVVGGGSTSMLSIRGGGAVHLNSGSNAYAGQVSVTPGATLYVNGQLPSTVGVQVQGGGRLGGVGDIASAVNVADGGRVNPGGAPNSDAAIGTLTTGPLTLSAESLLEFDLGSGGDQSGDQMVVNGDLTLDGLLYVSQRETFDLGDTYTLITFTGLLVNNGLEIDPSSPEIFGLPANVAAAIVVSTNLGGAGGTVSLVVPEPATSAVLLFGAWVAAARRRRLA